MIVITRDGKIKCNLPSVSERKDGTLWYNGCPLLAISDEKEKARIVKLVKAKKYNEIPAEHFAKMGKNPENVWVGDAKEWRNRPESVAKRAKEEAEKAKRGTVYLSSRGWGDYSSLEWTGDITKPTADILTECKSLLVSAHDVDEKNQTDEEIITRINKVRSQKKKKETEKTNEASRCESLFAVAKQTGKKQAIDSWMTEKCSEDLGDCSFDHAVKWAMPDGSIKTTYTHCH